MSSGRRFQLVVPRTDAAGELTTTMLTPFKTDAIIYSKEGEDFHVLLTYSTPRKTDYIKGLAVSNIMEDVTVVTTTAQQESNYIGWAKAVIPYMEQDAHPGEDSDEETITHVKQKIARKRTIKQLLEDTAHLQTELQDIETYLKKVRQ